MPNYRRQYCPGGTYFFTVALARTCEINLLGHLDVLRRSWAETLQEHPFKARAVVILPDHLHTVWTLPDGDADFSIRWRKIKARFSRSLTHPAPPNTSAKRRGEAGIWQRRFWDHVIRDEADLKLRLAYCWSDPVRHGLAGKPADWVPSSIHREIRAGRLDPAWQVPPVQGEFGERTDRSRQPTLIEEPA